MRDKELESEHRKKSATFCATKGTLSSGTSEVKDQES